MSLPTYNPTAEEPTVEEDDSNELFPKSVRTTRRVNNVLYVAGEGSRDARIMFVATSVLEEEAMETQAMTYGKAIKQRPRYLKGPPGVIFKDILGFVGIDITKCFYTALIKHLLPKATRSKPKRDEIERAAVLLYQEIEEVKPEIIVCLGKPVFDLLHEKKIKIPLSDIKCAWFRSERFNCRLYAMNDVTFPATKPEYVDKFRTDLMEVKRMCDRIDGIATPEVVKHYRTLTRTSDLAELLEMFDREKLHVHSVDCEWRGNNHVDGHLRSMQDAWAPGHAAYFKFQDEKQDYVFDRPYGEVGEVMQRYYNRPAVKYVGHHIAADFPWMHTWLGLDWYNKCIFDTEFGQQCIDEFDDLGLERIAIKYTDLGRYDLDLMVWLKENKQPHDAGYANVPDRIIEPYGCADVDTVIRAYPQMVALMAKQNLLNYFYGIFLPFVTNIFTQFALLGMPTSRPKMDELRDLFNFARVHMEEHLRKNILLEADSLLFRELMQLDVTRGALAFGKIRDLLQVGKHQEAFNELKDAVGVEHLRKIQPFFDHRLEAPQFNIRSTAHMRRWLFEVKRFTPIKTTNNKEKGLPSMPWHKVMELPPERQKEFQPSTDKQSLQILGEGDALVGELLELNAVGNLCKAFLKEPEVDEETGEVTRENGLHYWLCNDGRIHGQTSTTETGRPRAWKPNLLNWPSWVNKKISDGISKLMKRLHEDGQLPERFQRYLTDAVPSIRACVDVSTLEPLEGSLGWVYTESDYQTAEVRGLAYISGDANMIKMFEEPDTQFALIEGGNPEEDYVRISYAKDCGIKPEGQDPRVIMKRVSKCKVKEVLVGHEVPEGKTAREYAFELIEDRRAQGLAIPIDGETYYRLDPVPVEKLARGADGAFLSPRFDFHWNLAEMVNHKPRELMNKKAERGAAKIGNFSSAYGATGETLDRKIEADTGIKPPPGTGTALLEAIAKRQPVATAFLEAVAGMPRHPGYMVAASGRVRHFYLHPQGFYGLSSRVERGMAAAMGREGRNFYFQESVAATAARAGNWLLKFGRDHNLVGRPMVILYDSVVTLSPLEERWIWHKAHELYMFRMNGWAYGPRILNYPIDTEFNYAWSWRPSKPELKLLDSPDYAPVDPKHAPLMQWLDEQIAFYKANPKESVFNKQDLQAA